MINHDLINNGGDYELNHRITRNYLAHYGCNYGQSMKEGSACASV